MHSKVFFLLMLLSLRDVAFSSGPSFLTIRLCLIGGLTYALQSGSQRGLVLKGARDAAMVFDLRRTLVSQSIGPPEMSSLT